MRLLNTHVRNLVAICVIGVVALGLSYGLLDQRLRGLSIDVSSYVATVLNIETSGRVNSQVVILGIDEETYQTEPFRATPRVMWTPQIAEVINGLTDVGASLIGFDVVFPTSVRQFIPDYERDFLKTLRKTAREGRLVLGKVQHQAKPIAPEAAQSFAVGHSANVKTLNLEEDPDSVIRRVPRYFQESSQNGESVETRSFSHEIAYRFQQLQSHSSERKKLSKDQKESVLLNFDLRSDAIPTYSLGDVYQCFQDGQKDRLQEYFSGKIVLVGTVLDVEDRKLTSKRFAQRRLGEPSASRCVKSIGEVDQPVHLNARETIPGVFVHATAINNLIFDTELEPVGRHWELFLSVILVMLIAALVFQLPLGGVVPFLIFVSAVYLGIGVGGLTQGVAIPVLTSITASCVAFVMSLLFRYFVLDAKRRTITRAFSMYLSKHEVERLTQQEGLPRLGGETKTVSIFFSDIEGFTSISEQLNPEQLVSVLNRYLTLMTEAIEKHGGVVDKYVGDAVIAFFGAPVSHGDDATRSIDAAISCINAVKHDAQLKTLLPEIELKTRIGLNTGVALVGNIGSSSRLNYTIMGDQVNLAARLESANKLFGTTMLISESSVSHVDRTSELRKVARLRVKGRREPVLVYTINDSLNRQQLSDFERGLDLLARNRRDAEEMFASLRSVDSISSIYVDLINEASEAIGRLDADVIDLVSK
ncbi:MAG: adenylate/guanylate cyclase domain-containing protein [Betaproteobacteria bacterium]